MEFAEIKNELIKARDELNQVQTKLNELNKFKKEINHDIFLKKNAEIDLLKKLIDWKNILNQIIFLNLFRKWKALTSLSQIELDIIAYGMDKKDYRVYCDCPRWYDLERIAKEVIEFKKLQNSRHLESPPK